MLKRFEPDPFFFMATLVPIVYSKNGLTRDVFCLRGSFVTPGQWLCGYFFCENLELAIYFGYGEENLIPRWQTVKLTNSWQTVVTRKIVIVSSLEF